MAYLRTYIDPCAAYGWNGGPEFNTRIVSFDSGRERRNANWSEARQRYTLPFMNISREAYAAIRNMFQVCRGQLHVFLYRDPLNHTVENAIFGAGDGTETFYQLSKSSMLDGVIYTQNIYAIPDGEPVSVFVDGTPFPTGYTIDRDRGTITFDEPPDEDAVLSWSVANFDIWVRFAQDWLPFSIDNVNAHNGQVELMEMFPPLVTS